MTINGMRWALLIATIATAGCDRQSSKTAAPKAPAGTIVRAEAGDGPEQVGMVLREEGTPESPNSFVVDAQGRIHVLDQLNHRIQSFTAGSSVAKSVPLPARDFQDIELGGLEGDGFVLLDLHSSPAIVYVGADGAIQNEVALSSDDIPAPGLVTGVLRDERGVWVRLESTHRVQVADAIGEAVESSVQPGTLVGDGKVFRSNVTSASSIEIQQQALPDGAPAPLASLAFSNRVAEHALIGQSADGALLASVLLEGAQPDPESAPALSRVLVTVAPDGQERKRADLPSSTGAHTCFRCVRLGYDGKIYTMTMQNGEMLIGRTEP